MLHGYQNFQGIGNRPKVDVTQLYMCYIRKKTYHNIIWVTCNHYLEIDNKLQ